MPKKSHPAHVDPANPQVNFVEACYINHRDRDGFYDMMYGPPGSMYNRFEPEPKKASGYGHSIGGRAGKLRLSGNSNAHRIGKRSK